MQDSPSAPLLLAEWRYDAVGQLILSRSLAYSGLGTTELFNVACDALNRPTQQQWSVPAAGGVSRFDYGYTTAGQRASLRYPGGNAGQFGELATYGYNAIGQLKSLTGDDGTQYISSTSYNAQGQVIDQRLDAVGVGQYSHTYQYNAIGNLTAYNGSAYSYGTRPHAVTGAFGNSYGDDANGNQTSRIIAGTPYTQTFDYDNRLTAVAGGSVSADFVHDADGNRVKGTVVGVTTVYIAGIYEYQGGAVTKYCEGGALRRMEYATDNGVFYVVSDHPRPTSVLVNQDDTLNSRNYYYPYGGNRGGSAFRGITTKCFTGQSDEQGLPGGERLSYYNARWYDACLR